MVEAETVLPIAYQAEETAAEARIWIRLDAAMNEEQTRFDYGETAYFQIFTEPVDLALEVAASDGAVSYQGRGSTEETEVMSFEQTDRAEAGLPIARIVSASWLGNDLGGATGLGGAAVKAARAGLGVLKLTYRADFRRYGLRLGARPEDEYPVLVRVSGGSAHAALTLVFQQSAAEYGAYQVRAVSFCSGDPIPAASVYLDGNLIGSTDEDGRIELGDLAVGSEHTLRIEASGLPVFEDTFTAPEAA